MNVKEAHFAFKLAFDRINSLSAPSFNEAEVDAFLNEAQLVFIKTRFSEISNSKRKGFEQSQKRIDDLSLSVVSYPTQPAITPTLLVGGKRSIYTISTKDLAYPYLFLVSITDGAEDPCDSLEFKVIRQEQLETLRKNPYIDKTVFYSISYDPAYLDSPAIYLHSTKPLERLRISYIKYPSKVSTGNYIHYDGIQHPENTFELAPHTHQEIVDIAAQLAALSIQDPAYVQTRNQKVLVNE